MTTTNDALRESLQDVFDAYENENQGYNFDWDSWGDKAREALAQQAAPEAANSGDFTYALILLTAAAKSGDPKAIELAAQLAGYAPCPVCKFVKQHCRCAVAEPEQQAQEALK